MTEEETLIESYAQDYFSNRSKQNEARLWESLYKALFVKKIYLKQMRSYSDLLDEYDIDDYKINVITKSLETAKNNYLPESGNSFINYISTTLVGHCKNELNEIAENKRYDDSLDKEVDAGTEKASNYEEVLERSGKITSTRNEGELEFERQQEYISSLKKLKQFFAVFEKFYTASKSGAANKSKTYTYLALSGLIAIEKQDAEKFINMFSFLQPQRDNIIQIINNLDAYDYQVPSQKEYAKLVNMPEAKISEFKKEVVLELEKFL